MKLAQVGRQLGVLLLLGCCSGLFAQTILPATVNPTGLIKLS